MFVQNARNSLQARKLQRTSAYDLTCRITVESEGSDLRVASPPGEAAAFSASSTGLARGN